MNLNPDNESEKLFHHCNWFDSVVHKGGPLIGGEPENATKNLELKYYDS